MFSPNDDGMSIGHGRFIAPLRPKAICEMSFPDDATSQPGGALRIIGLTRPDQPSLRGGQNLMTFSAYCPCISDGAAEILAAAMAHDHHHHEHPSTNRHGRAFAWGIGLNLAFVLIEASFGVLANSMALLADAGHNLSDVLGLVVAWVAVVLARRPPSARFTYGLRAGSILAALFNALFLLVAVGWMAWEAVGRLSHPEPVAEMMVIAVAGIGILVNGLTAWLFSGGKGDLNIRGAYLHMAADAAVSAAVMLGALAMRFTGWLWLDPMVSLAVGAVIIWSGWGLLRDSLGLALGAVPSTIDPAEVSRFLCAHPGVESLHDLHIWAMSTTETALTAHLVMPAGHPGDAFLMALAKALEGRFAIGHVTLQVETDPNTACALSPGHVV